MAEYKSITEGAVLCGTLIGWNYFFDWLAYRYPAFQKFLKTEPLPVIKDGGISKTQYAARLVRKMNYSVSSGSTSCRT